VLRTNNEGEFTSIEFTDFYKEVGIKREKIVAAEWRCREEELIDN